MSEMSDTTNNTCLPSSSSVKMTGFLGKHGPCSFFKSIKTGDKTYSISQFMPVKIWPDSAMLNIANIQLLWSDKTESFCSLKLYFLPENTPDGRLQQHGEDEVIALQDKVTIRAADLSSILVEGSEWDWGFQTPSVTAAPLNTVLSKSFVSEKLNEDKLNGTTAMSGSNSIVVLSYPRYMRLRTILKRLEGSPDIQRWLESPLVLALGALNVGPNCRVLYAKESFDHPDIEDNDLLCNNPAAPNLKAKKRRTARKRNASRGSVSNESLSSSCSFGSYKENEQKRLNGIKLEIDDKRESAKRRGSTSNGSNKYGEHKLWIKSEPGLAKKTKRSNGISSGVEHVVKIGDNGDWDSKAQLLGPALTELAQKLERSNALQILPIRPSANSNIDENYHENHHMLKKRRKIEYPTSSNPSFNKRTGPYDSKSLAVGPPGENRAERLNSIDSPLLDAHTIPLQISKLTRVDINWKPLTLTGSSPCLFIPLDTVFCDPNDAKRHARFIQQGVKQGAETKRNLDVMDFSQQQQPKSRQEKGGSGSRSSSTSLMSKNRSRSALCSAKMPTIDDPPASSTMNQMGVRLTSEVTLFPSKYLPSYPSSLDGVMQHNFANPRHSANAALSNSKTTHEIDIQPWNPSSSAGSSRAASTPTIKEHVTAKKHTKGAYDRTSQSQSQSSSKSIGSSTDQQKELSAAMSAQNAFMHPYFGKMDPTYLHFLANATPLFMPPPPPNFMSIPGAVEQFYKDFFMQSQGQGLPPGFPSFPPGPGNDRGSKS